MMQNWIVSVYKADKRYSSGERFVAKYPFLGADRDAIERQLLELTYELYPKKDGWRFDVQELTK
jgi:hypothetical protein